MAAPLTSPVCEVPDHVPPELVWDHDLDAFTRELDDPYRAAARLFDGPNIIWATKAWRGGPSWLPTRTEIIREVLLDAENFRSGDNGDLFQLIGEDWPINPVDINPPEHMAYRKILGAWFVPSAVKNLEHSVKEVAQQLIDTFAARGGCEFISEFASIYPSYVFLDLMGLPRDMLGKFLAWERDFLHSAVHEDRVRAAHAINDYLAAYVERRKAEPPRNDLISTILAGEVHGRPLNHGEIMGMIINMFLGGLDTVMASLGWYFQYLAKDQALQSRLRNNPDDLPGVVDDLLRAFGVVALVRTVSRDMEFYGVRLKKGDHIMAPTYLASRDPSQYERPDIVDPDRKARNLTLGTGIHNCLGIHLAKREIKVVLELFLQNFTNIRISDGQAFSWYTGPVWGVKHLPLVWDRRQQTTG